MKILNARDRNADILSSGLPDVSAGVEHFFQPITVDLVVKTQTDGYTEEEKKRYKTQGTVQPFSAKELKILPEGQRGWKWTMLHCLPGLCLDLDDIVIIRGVRSRVMGSKDFSEYGYKEYHLAEGYTDA